MFKILNKIILLIIKTPGEIVALNKQYKSAVKFNEYRKHLRKLEMEGKKTDV